MNKLKKYTLVLSALMVLLAVTGCDYVPLKIYEVETKDGQVIKLSCPTIDRGRNTLTYIVDRHCTLVK